MVSQYKILELSRNELKKGPIQDTRIPNDAVDVFLKYREYHGFFFDPIFCRHITWIKQQFLGEWAAGELARPGRKTEEKKTNWEFEEATCYFISNLPHSFSAWEIRKSLTKIGDLVDLFVCKRRDKRGYRFGFVRFNQAKKGRDIEETLKKTWLGGRILYVRIARFGREKGREEIKGNRRVQEEKICNKFDRGRGLRTPNVSFVDVVKGCTALSGEDKREQEQFEPIGNISYKVRIMEVEDKLFKSQPFTYEENYKEERNGDLSTDGEGEDLCEDSDEGMSEDFSGEEDERSFEESACRETNFEMDLKVGEHVHIMEVEGFSTPVSNKNRSGYNPGSTDNPIALGGQAEDNADASPIKDKSFKSQFSSPSHPVGQEKVMGRTLHINKDPNNTIVGNRPPDQDDTQLGEDSANNLQGVS
ncbi:hypothetical protein L2E82_10357 [Cichorium intybus]|uniref:Uncharacterized protein n=1 Tax=Cichorium intybus TaxID=13427 RepID=A0ACB9GAG3_CICIN|nr:hypothetical protein L2E82_10357 [Cichorium intybus]